MNPAILCRNLTRPATNGNLRSLAKVHCRHMIRRHPRSIPTASFRAALLALGAACAFTAAARDGAPATAPPAAAAANPAAAAGADATRALSVEQLTRLELVVVRQGTSVPVPQPIAQAAHFTPTQVAPVVRQVSFLDDDGVKHGFAFLNDHSGYFLFRRHGDQDLSVYHVDLSFHIVGAAHNFQGSRFMELPEHEATDGLGGEILAWNRVMTPRATGAKEAAGAPASAAAASKGAQKK